MRGHPPDGSRSAGPYCSLSGRRRGGGGERPRARPPPHPVAAGSRGARPRRSGHGNRRRQCSAIDAARPSPPGTTEDGWTCREGRPGAACQKPMTGLWGPPGPVEGGPWHRTRHLRWTRSSREDVVRACTSPAGVPAPCRGPRPCRRADGRCDRERPEHLRVVLVELDGAGRRRRGQRHTASSASSTAASRPEPLTTKPPPGPTANPPQLDLTRHGMSKVGALVQGGAPGRRRPVRKGIGVDYWSVVGGCAAAWVEVHRRLRLTVVVDAGLAGHQGTHVQVLPRHPAEPPSRHQARARSRHRHRRDQHRRPGTDGDRRATRRRGDALT